MKEKKVLPYVDYEEAFVDSLRKDPEFAVVYLNDVLGDGDIPELLMALRRISRAFGGVPRLAAKAGVNPTSLYRALSEKGNPEVRSLVALLKAMGMKLAVQPIRPSARKKKVRRPTATM